MTRQKVIQDKPLDKKWLKDRRVVYGFKKIYWKDFKCFNR